MLPWKLFTLAQITREMADFQPF